MHYQNISNLLYCVRFHQIYLYLFPQIRLRFILNIFLYLSLIWYKHIIFFIIGRHVIFKIIILFFNFFLLPFLLDLHHSITLQLIDLPPFLYLHFSGLYPMLKERFSRMHLLLQPMHYHFHQDLNL